MNSNNSLPETVIIKDNKNVITNESIPSEGAENNSSKSNKQDWFQCKICPYNTFRKPFVEKHMIQKHGFAPVRTDNKNKSSCSGFAPVRTDNKDESACSEQMDVEILRNNGSQEGKAQLEIYNDTDCKTRDLHLLNVHQAGHEGQKKELFQCVRCEFQSEKVSALQGHEKTHKKLTLFQCPNSDCDYETRQRYNLRAHMRVHQEPEKMEKFSCATCNEFVSFHYSALSRHIRVKHGTDGVPFKCEKCPFTAKVQRHLTNHQRIHASRDDVPMFKCEQCNFITYNEQTIQRHVKAHEARQKDGEEVLVKETDGEKEIIWFCCNMCKFKSKDQRYVRLHKKVHSRVDEINKVGESIVQSAEIGVNQDNS